MSTIGDWWVTPKRRLSDLPKDITLDVKIDIFHERVYGWKLNIADQLINGVKDSMGKIVIEGNPHAGYAVLDIIMSYFEMIAKYHDGYTGLKSRPYFEKGVHLVFPELKDKDSHLVKDVLDILYKGTRCGLYHSGVTDNRVLLMGGEYQPITLYSNRKVVINPHKLVLVLKKHFNDYITQLKYTDNSKLRQNFEKRFDEDTSP